MSGVTSGSFGVGYRLTTGDDDKPVTRMELDEQIGRKVNRTAVEELEKRISELEVAMIKVRSTLGV